MQVLKAFGVLAACLTLTVPALAPVLAATQNRAGKPTAKAKPNINRPAPKPAGKNTASRNAGKPKATNKQAYNAGQASAKRKKGNNVIAGNTVVVGGRPGSSGGYYSDGRYYDNDRYDDDDNDFLEFVGKTAAITAGVSVVAAVIGSTTTQKPSGCQPVVSGGIQYQYCDGVYYQQTQQNGQPAYQVVGPPAQ